MPNGKNNSGSRDTTRGDTTHRWALGLAITCLSPIAAAAVLLLLGPFGGRPGYWFIAYWVGIAAAFGSALGPMFTRRSLAWKTCVATLCAAGGFAAYVALFTGAAQYLY